MRLLTPYKKIVPLSYNIYFIPVVILTILGIADTLYLSYSHYQNYTNIDYSSFCALTKSINCDTVSQSPWSILAGIPTAIWGLIGYFLLIPFLVSLRDNKGTINCLWVIMLYISIIYSLFSLYFGYISATKIKAYCILCVLSYAINLSLAIYCWLIVRRFVHDPLTMAIKNASSYIFANNYLKVTYILFFLIIIFTKLFIPPYWELSFTLESQKVQSGITSDGHPWIGAEKPILTIEEYTDYQCFQCYKTHFFLRQLLIKYPGKIKLIHRNYPMEHRYNPIIVQEQYHIGSGKMALIAIYASTKGKFWETNDALYILSRQKQSFNTSTLAKSIGISSTELTRGITNSNIQRFLTRDIWQGMKLRIFGTPSFVINGKVYEGSIPSEILQQILEK